MGKRLFRQPCTRAWFLLPVCFVLLSCGSPASSNATFESRSSKACASFIRSRPSPAIALTYQLQVSGTEEDIRERDHLIKTIARLTPPHGHAKLVGQFVAALQAIDTQEQAALASLERTHSPILSLSIGDAWQRHVRQAQRIARELDIPACAAAAAL
jgi:hypothetical protein